MRDRNAPLTEVDIAGLAWDKMGGLIPAVVQDQATGQVLMLGYMSPASLTMTLRDRQATFFSRARQELWTKGATSGNYLQVTAVHADCDGDALLLLATPSGPTCHLGSVSCFEPAAVRTINWLEALAAIVKDRSTADVDESYTARLLQSGGLRIAQKVGEEGLELALAGATNDRAACIGEAADLIFHMTVLLQAQGVEWSDVAAKLASREKEHG